MSKYIKKALYLSLVGILVACSSGPQSAANKSQKTRFVKSEFTVSEIAFLMNEDNLCLEPI